MSVKPSDPTLLSFYLDKGFNPVPIEVTDEDAWKVHVAKRCNLYGNHLKIPLSLLAGKSILEFGCNSGENPLAAASFGAELTLVEPNSLVLPRLRSLFESRNLQDQIKRLENTDIDSFQSDEKYDLVIAEGFINCLANRDEVVKKFYSLCKPGGFVIISFDDRYGSLLECTRQLLHKRCLEADKVTDEHSEESFQLARRLFEDDFARLNASRPFKAWWQDVLLNPHFSAPILWSFQEILPLISRIGGVFHSCSPVWSDVDHFQWYKNLSDGDAVHEQLLDGWNRDAFTYFLTGLKPINSHYPPATATLLETTTNFIGDVSAYIAGKINDPQIVAWPVELNDYLNTLPDKNLQAFNTELNELFGKIMDPEATAERIIETYRQSELLRTLWGCPYHYICFR